MSNLEKDLKGMGISCIAQAALLAIAGIVAIGLVVFRYIVPAFLYYLISRH